MNSENIKKVTAQAIEQLVEALNAGHSEALTRYLGAIAKFRAYSFLNVLLILKQSPNAGRVAGYKTWQSLGRQVKQGEKGIMILAPMFRKLAERKDETAESEESRRVAGFRSVYVWDEQQTTGNELPHIGSITGDPSIYLERLEAFVRASGLELAYSDAIAPAKGMAEKGRITLLPGQSAAETFATLVHEVAHSDMHFGPRRCDTDKRVRETEAESVAYVVCSAIGLDPGTGSETPTPTSGPKPLPPIATLLEQGKIVALNFPASMNPGLARAVGVMLKMDFQRAVLNRIPHIAAEPKRPWRSIVFICDEYQHFATVGENEPSGDEKFLSMSRQAKCVPIVATQSISSLKTTLPGETWRTLLQTFRTKIFLSLSDDFSAKIASELCGQDERWQVNYNISESGHDSRVSYLTGKPLADKAHISASKTYSQQRDYRFDMKTFTELKNAQSVTLAYDGLDPLPPMFCYLKPYFNDVNKSYFRQLADGQL